MLYNKLYSDIYVVVKTINAKEDLKRRYPYGFDNFGEQKADVYYDELFEAFERIAQNPSLYPVIEHIRNDYRRCPCGSDSIYYRIKNDFVELMAIIGGQDTDI